MKQTWRWFGPSDAISIAEIRQTGARGIVSALHHVPPGQVWPVADIKERQQLIENPKGVPSDWTCRGLQAKPPQSGGM